VHTQNPITTTPTIATVGVALAAEQQPQPQPPHDQKLQIPLQLPQQLPQQLKQETPGVVVPVPVPSRFFKKTTRRLSLGMAGIRFIIILLVRQTILS